MRGWGSGYRGLKPLPLQTQKFLQKNVDKWPSGEARILFNKNVEFLYHSKLLLELLFFINYISSSFVKFIINANLSIIYKRTWVSLMINVHVYTYCTVMVPIYFTITFLHKCCSFFQTGINDASMKFPIY